jgi:DNA-directed RNA polymerase specialized sigma24 family protein
VELLGQYSNRVDLLEQLRKTWTILSESQNHWSDTGVASTAKSVTRSRRLCDRFSPEDLQAMIDLYRSGTTARQVAAMFDVSLRSVKRLLREHGVRRDGGVGGSVGQL